MESDSLLQPILPLYITDLSISWLATKLLPVFILWFLFWKPFKLYILAQYVWKVRLSSLGKWAVVTGGTDGLGKEYARALASKGLNVILIGRSEDKLNKVKTEITRDYSVSVKTIQADFTSTVIYDRIAKELEGLEIAVLVNNVGMAQTFTPFLQIPDIAKTAENLLNVNCISMIRMTKLLLPNMLERNKGVIINISSCVSNMEAENVSIYSATKSFITKLSACIRREHSSSGVIIQTIVPGMIQTKLLKSFHSNQPTESELLQQKMLAVTPKAFVSYAINTIGWVDECAGHPKHHFLTLYIILFLLVSLIKIK